MRDCGLSRLRVITLYLRHYGKADLSAYAISVLICLYIRAGLRDKAKFTVYTYHCMASRILGLRCCSSHIAHYLLLIKHCASFAYWLLIMHCSLFIAYHCSLFVAYYALIIICLFFYRALLIVCCSSCNAHYLLLITHCFVFVLSGIARLLLAVPRHRLGTN